MTRRALLLAAFAVAAFADAESDVWDLFTRMASALSNGNAREFLSAVDPAAPGYEALRANVNALVQQADVQSSIEVVENTGDTSKRNVEMDWLLVITDRQDTANIARRRERVKCRVEKSGKKWRIVSLEPVKLFAPPRP
ncbi:MAG TPA: hypothetical protein VGF59_08755 [Bryobacteraceae bacterium]|jgi:hypothetical protein